MPSAVSTMKGAGPMLLQVDDRRGPRTRRRAAARGARAEAPVDGGGVERDQRTVGRVTSLFSPTPERYCAIALCHCGVLRAAVISTDAGDQAGHAAPRLRRTRGTQHAASHHIGCDGYWHMRCTSCQARS